jgi:intein/homing endonuclease
MSDEIERLKKPKKLKKSELVYAASPVAHDIMVNSDNFELTDGEFTMKKAESLGGKKKPGIAFMEDPIVKDTYQGSLRLKKKLLPDNVIKDISNQNHLVAAILRSTGNVISQFGHLRKDRFDIGIDVEIKGAFKDKISIEDMPIVQERIQTFTKFLLNCGHTDDLKISERSPLSDFMYMQGFNAYRFGRFATQMVYGDNAINSPSTLQRFRAVDVGTMYRVQQKDRIDGKDTKSDQDAVRMSSIQRLKELTGVDINPENFKQPEYSWGQMINGKVEQYFSDKEMVIYNAFPSTDVEHDGYPVSPLDTVITSVTTHISIETYNRLYFQNGRAAKGMLVVHSDEIDQSIIDHVKQQFNASINDVSNSFRTPIFGVNQLDKVEWVTTQATSRDGEFQFLYDQVARNIFSAFGVSPDEIPGYGHLSKGTNQASLNECFHILTQLIVPEGMRTAKDILGNNKSIETMVWTGKKWAEAKIFHTENKRLHETFLEGGLSIKTSPDHRFQVIDESGDPVWKQQHELVVGDFILTNKEKVTNVIDVPIFKEKELTPDLMEVLGWMIGDGNVNDSRYRVGAQIHLYYHQDKEKEIRNRHFNILKEFGLNPILHDCAVSDEESNLIKEKYGFQTVAKERIKINLYDTQFVKWLFSLGFHASKDKKVIPNFIYTLPIEHRQAFLRGLFSADGHISKSTSDTPIVTIYNDELRNQTRLLLNTLGIRTNTCEGKTKQIFKGIERETVEAKTKLIIKDKRSFFSQIGFLQNHKQPNINSLEGFDPQSIPRSTQLKYVQRLIDSNLPRKYKKDLYAFVSDNEKRKMSAGRLLFLLKKANLEVPEWIETYRFQRIDRLIDHKEHIPMVDVTVYDNNHAFVANGIIVHNSSNEYKMTASRDRGIRPFILRMQSWFNDYLFPMIDPELAQLCVIRLEGFDAQTREQENTRLTTSAPLHMTYDELLDEVDKKGIGKSLGGNFPFNEYYNLISDKYSNVGFLIAETFGLNSAHFDPTLKYRRDAFYIQNLQLLAQNNPAAVKALFASKDNDIDMLKELIQEELEEETEEDGI